MLSLTAIYRKVAEGYVGYAVELPGAHSQGDTLEEARANLREAVSLVVAASRELAAMETAAVEVVREPIDVSC